MSDRIAAEAFPPGEYLRDELDERGWTQIELSEIIGRSPRVINEIVTAKRAVTPETAKELAAAFGTSAQFWMNLETAYQLHKAKPANKEISRQAELHRKFPVREMCKRNWIEATKDKKELEAKVLSFFNIKSIDEPVCFHHAAKRSGKTSLSGIQLAWLFRVKKLAEAIPSKKYSESALRYSLYSLEKLLVEPEEARHVPKILAECGVRFVIVEPMPGSKIDGVCFWLNNNTTPVVGMSLRFDRIDNFWFVLRHEIEHVLQKHGQSEFILDEDLSDDQEEQSEEEAVANAAAQEFCAPMLELKDFVLRVTPFFSEQKVVAFSKRIGRHPGMVSGQLQRAIERPELLNKLKSKIRQFVTGSAFTDGWGMTAPI